MQKVSLGSKHAVADEAFKFTAKPATSFKRTELIIASPTSNQKIGLEILRARYGKPYPMPFEIPKDFEIRNGL